MTKRNIHQRSTTAIVAVIIALGACGGDDDDDGAGADTTVSGTAAAPAASDAATTAPAVATTPAPMDAPATAATGEPTSESTTAPGAEVDPGWDAIIDAAEAEGKVVLYSVNFPEQNVRLEEAFEAAYPAIDLEVVRVTSEIDAKLDSERDTGTEVRTSPSV